MNGKQPKLLVLDGQGVVFDAPIRRFLRRLASDYGIDYSSVLRRWKGGLREQAWRGAIDDERLWDELVGRQVDHQRVMRALHASYRPGPAHALLAGWSAQVPLWLLSNHRSAWLTPYLRAFSLHSVFDRILISDSTGHVKPEEKAFRQLLRQDMAADDILFVDDQLHNVEAAQRLGMRTVHAVPSRPWLVQIDMALGSWMQTPRLRPR